MLIGWKLIGWRPWYQTVYHGYDKNIYFDCSNYVGNQFIIEIRNLRSLWYMADIPRLRAVSSTGGWWRLHLGGRACVNGWSGIGGMDSNTSNTRFKAVPFAPFQTLLWAVLPSAASALWQRTARSCGIMTVYHTSSLSLHYIMAVYHTSSLSLHYIMAVYHTSSLSLHYIIAVYHPSTVEHHYNNGGYQQGGGKLN